VSALGSGTNENQFLFDGTNFTCPCNGVARSEPGIEFIQEIQVQSIGASAEFGNMQGAVINVVTRQGGERFLSDTSFYGQPGALTSQPVRLPIAGSQLDSGYVRARYRDFTTDLGGPAIPNRLWFFGGYQHVRDFDSQPGADPAGPRALKQDRIFTKLTWRFTPRWQLMQSFHREFGIYPDRPTSVTPLAATSRPHASVPAMTFGHLTHTMSANSVWDVRVGRFIYSIRDEPTAIEQTIASQFDLATGITRGAPASFMALTIERTTAKTTLTHYRPALWRADHQMRIGAQLERGEHHAITRIPTGVRYNDSAGQPIEAVSAPAANVGGVSITASAFASDAITMGDRSTVSVGVRFDQSRAISQDLPAVDANGRETAAIVRGLGRMYTWNIVSPRLGVTMKLTKDGRTMLRGSYGRFSQGVLTGELQPFHPAAPAVTTRSFNPAADTPDAGNYSGAARVVDPKLNLSFNPHMRAPRTDEYSVGIDHAVGRQLSTAVAYIHKSGANFVGWTDTVGIYHDETRPLADGTEFPVKALVNKPSDRRFLLTNAPGYSLTYDGLVMAIEKRRSRGWQASGSYTLSRATGLQTASGTTAAGAQVSTVAPPQPSAFGRDPNDLTNARGRLANDRPHMFRLMGAVDVPRTGLMIAGNLQYFSGKPWAASGLVALPQTNNQSTERVLLEPRGSRRLSSQTVLDLRISRVMAVGRAHRVELMLDVLNLLNDTAEESIATDNIFSKNFAQPTVYIDPRRVMIGVKMALGR